MTIRWDTSQVDRALANLGAVGLGSYPADREVFGWRASWPGMPPVLTGNLRRSLHPEESHPEHVESVEQTGAVIEVQVGTNLEYAPDTEFRSRKAGWAAQSLREGEAPALEDMAEAARQIIEAAAA